MAADRLEPAGGAAVQLQLRGTAAADHFHVAPENAVRVAGAERFHRRLFGGETPGEMNRGVAATHAVRDFVVREDAMSEALAVALDAGGDAGDVRSVEADSD